MGTQILYVTGGEPLLRNDVFKVFHLAKKAGMQIGIGTNSYLVEKYAGEFMVPGESFAGLEITHLHKNGHLVIVEVSGVPILDSSGAGIGYRGYYQQDLYPGSAYGFRLYGTPSSLNGMGIFRVSPYRVYYPVRYGLYGYGGHRGYGFRGRRGGFRRY